MEHARNAEPRLEVPDFEKLALLAHSEFGLKLPVEKLSLVQSRLRARLSSLSLDNFSDYCSLVLSKSGLTERTHLISALTTNVSHFYRERHHFAYIGQHILPDIVSKLQNGGRVRLWSAGCSKGQEACTLTMVMLAQEPRLAEWDFRVLATDIDPKVVEFAQQGIYSQSMVGTLSEHELAQSFDPVGSPNDPKYKVKDAIRDLISFRELNLLSEWPMKHKFEVILCRNVVIYFDLDTQQALWPRFHQALSPHGHLIVGHSERIQHPEATGFHLKSATTYQRTPTPISSI